MGAIHAWTHQTLGMCFYTLPALLIGVIMIVVGLLHWRRQDKREADFKKELIPVKKERPVMTEMIPDPMAGDAEEEAPEDEEKPEEDEEV